MNLQQLTKFSFTLLFSLLLGTVVFAQDREIKGQITDAEGKPVPGVTITIKGTSSMVITDAQGKYVLRATPDQILVFSSVGFSTKEIKVADHRNISTQLAKSDSQLDDVIVVGYGVQKKGHLTGAVEAIKAKDIEDLPVSNLGAALSGRVLGLGVSGGTQRPGSRATLTIRNPETFSKDGGTTDALYVIDGIIQVTADGKNDNTQFNNLDPSEVESITVLKDGAAAIYGSRAANGVIIVSTKRGKAGAPKFSYSGSYGVNDEAYRTKMMSAYDFAQYYNIMNGPNGSNNVGLTNYKEYVFSPDEVEHFKTINYDWLDPVWKKSHNMRHTVNVSGGTDRATYFASASYYTQDGNYGFLDYKKWTFRAGSDINVASGLKTGIQVSGNWGDISRTFNKVNSEDPEDDYRNLLLAPRYVPEYVDGYPVKLPSASSEKLGAYHYYEIQRLKNITETKDKSLMVNMYAEYSIPFVKGLKAKVNYAKYFTGSFGTQVGTKFTLYDFNKAGAYQHIYDSGATVKLPGTSYKNGDRLYYSNLDGQSSQINFMLSYEKQIGRHSISGLFSVERGEASSRQADVWKEAPLLSTNGQFSSAFGAVDGKTTGSESGTLGYIGRLNYNYASKYLLEFLFRSDASTHFAPENYWGKFYSVSAGWVVSNETFFNVPAVNYLKLRMSSGLLGRDDTKAWLWRQRYTFQGGKGAVFGGNANTSTGMQMDASPNRDAHWSNEFKNNLGIDARFLNNRLALTVEGFYNKGADMLMERTATVPLTVGGSIAAENWGKMDFYGYELSLGWNDNIGRDFTYGVTGMLTWYDNKWKQGNFAETDALYPWKKQKGQSDDNGTWGYDYLGMFKDQQEIDDYVKAYGITQVFGTVASKLKPGMLYYKDVRGALQPDGTFAGPDGIINENDQIRLSKKADNHYGFALNLRAGYKGIGLDCVIGGSFGGWAEIDGDARKKMKDKIAESYQSRPAIWGDIYDPVLNPTGKLPNPYYESISLTPTSTFWRVSAFRMAMKNVNLNYTLPKKITSAIHMASARVAFTVLNPMYLYNPYSYKSPDGDYDVYPTLKTYSLGINTTF